LFNLIFLLKRYEKLDEKRRVANTSYRSEIKILSNKIESIKRQIQEYDESQNQNWLFLPSKDKNPKPNMDCPVVCPICYQT